jgi:excisionase family DNA binding protein
MLTTAQVAAILKITRRRVHAIIAAGRLPARKHGRDWLIEPADLAAYRPLPAGRPAGHRLSTATENVHLPTVCSDCGTDLWWEYDPDDDTPMCERCWRAYH